MFESYTPQEIAEMRALNERAQMQGALDAQRLNQGLNIAQNLSPLGSFGLLLGTLGGRLANNYLANRDRKKIEDAQQRMNLLNMQVPRWDITPNQGLFNRRF